jgi:hypothetical protein
MSVDHCRDVPNNILSFRNKWNGVSGIYKITFLLFGYLLIMDLHLI